MIVKSKNKLLSIFYAFAILCSISCDNRSSGKNNHLVDDMKIFSAVIDTIAVHIRPPRLWPASPPQHRFKKVLTWEDSIMYNKNMIKFINMHRIIAIDTNLVIYISDFNTSEKALLTNDFSAITKAYDSSLSSLHIDINKIKLKKVINSIYFDSITYLEPDKHLRRIRKNRKGKKYYGTYLGGVSYRFNFSKIVYNKEKTKAAIRCTYRFEDRYPNGTMFLLEKQEDDWKIVKSKFFFGY